MSISKKTNEKQLKEIARKIQIEEELEDNYLGELALKAVKEGYIGAKESEKLL